MKISNLVTFNFLCVIVAAGLFSSSLDSVLNLWSYQDLEDFLEDRGIKHKRNSNVEELKKLASEQWGKLTESEKPGFLESLKQKVLSASNSVPTYNGYLQTYPDWIFSTWSKKDLYKFIHKHGIKFLKDEYNRVLTNEELVDIIKKNWDSVVSNLDSKSSGLYPGSWLYEDWSIVSLKKWLKDHDIEYSITDSRETLLDKVRKNIYYISSGTKSPSHQKLLKDKVTGYVKSFSGGPFENWSADDIKEYLKANKESVTGSAEDAAARALEIYNSKKEDAKQSYEQLSKKVAEHSAKASKSADDAVKSGIKSVKDLKFSAPAYLFDTVSADDLKLWLKKNKKSTEGSIDELYDRAIETYEEAVKDVVREHEKTKKHVSAASEFFRNWSLQDLKEWLQAHKESAEGDFEELNARATNSFNQLYLKLNDAFTKQQKVVEPESSYKRIKSSVARYWNSLTGKGNAAWNTAHDGFFSSSIQIKNPYLVTPTDGIFTKIYKRFMSGFRYYVLGYEYVQF